LLKAVRQFAIITKKRRTISFQDSAFGFFDLVLVALKRTLLMPPLRLPW
jgi:hypothetical protein